MFERHPELKFVTTEIAGASELARDLDMMAGLRDMGTGTPFYAHVKDALEELTRPPSDYFAVQLLCGRTARSTSGEGSGHPESDVGSRHTPFGGNRSLHPRSASRLSWDLPELELDTLLASTAVKVYGFPRDRLQPVADRIGPTVAELQTKLPAGARPKYPEETCCAIFREVVHV